MQRTNEQIIETGRKAFGMGIALENIPFKTELEKKLLGIGWNRAAQKFFTKNPKSRRRS